MNKVYFSFFLLMVSLSSLAQDIRGEVLDFYKRPIHNVDIFNRTTGLHTHSDKKGGVVLANIKVGDVIQFSHINYITESIVINQLDQQVNITLLANTVDLNQVIITPKISSLNQIVDMDMQFNPVNSSQDILKKVPGLFIGQHAGGGKAEQIFLRGFDIDHGTDINISVDGLPVNMVSHTHGQGYADLHFLIPETIDKVDFGKGLYYSDKGNFATAGYVSFKTKDRLENSFVKLELGQFKTSRLLGMFSLLDKKYQSAYLTTEFLSTDGYFDSSQNFNRINIFGKYTANLSDQDKLGIVLSHFDSKWDASAQIPERAVADSTISYFGAIDDTEGGSTSRTNFLVNYDKKISETTFVKNTVFLNHYDFELYSNFTFFLEDPLRGDQIRQKENRLIYGLQSEYNKIFETDFLKGDWKLGISLRNDRSKDNELSHTANRTQTIEQIQLGDINEINLGVYLGTSLYKGKWTFNPSVRFDYFDFEYYDKLSTSYEIQNYNKAIVSPKLNLLYNYSKELQFYLKIGKGFHSNDTRVVISNNNEYKNALPWAYGMDLGYTWKPTSKVLVDMAYWYLYLQQEFVYVGDAGIVEPSGETARQGMELSFRYQPFYWLFWNLDANYTHARSLEASSGQDYIPLAPNFTFTTGLNMKFTSGLYSGINLRHLADRPANEDNSIVAQGYTVVDLNVGYKWHKFDFGVQIQNLFNTKWYETQFATESRLNNESQSVEEIHFTPGTPFFFKTFVKYGF